MLRSEAPAERAHGPAKGTARRSFGRLRQERSGRWSAAYKAPTGVLVKGATTFRTEDAARGWLNDERKLIDLGEWTPPEHRGQRKRQAAVLLNDYAASWLDTRTVKGQPLKPRTRDHYQRILDRLILPTFGTRPVASITPEDVDAWYDNLGTGTPTLRSHAYSLLRTILAAAVDKGILPTNPAHIRGAGATRRAHKVEPLDLDELRALVEAMPEDRRLMVLLAAWCALRFGELTELRRKDVDVTNAVVKIRRGVVRTSTGVVVGTPKSDAGTRDVAIPPHLMPLVRDHLRDHTDPGRESLLFPAASGGNLAPSTFYGENPTRVKVKGQPDELRGGHGFYRARAVAGRPGLHFHDLRHTGAVLAAQTGATLAELMGRLGHSTPAAAMRYQHAAKDRDKAIAAALSQLATAGTRGTDR